MFLVYVITRHVHVLETIPLQFFSVFVTGSFVVKAFGVTLLPTEPTGLSRLDLNAPPPLHLVSWSATQSTITSGKVVYLKPLMPRYLRISDTVHVGVVVSADPDFISSTKANPITVEVKLHITGLSYWDSTQSSAATKVVTLNQNHKRIYFPLVADKGLGKASVVFSLRKTTSQSNDNPQLITDAVMGEFEVLPYSQPIVSTTSAAVTAATKEEIPADGPFLRWTEGLQVPHSRVENSGGLNFTATVGFTGPILALTELGISRRYKFQLNTRPNDLVLLFSDNSFNSVSSSPVILICRLYNPHI